jgi:hypothetical protein
MALILSFSVIHTPVQTNLSCLSRP